MNMKINEESYQVRSGSCYRWAKHQSFYNLNYPRRRLKAQRPLHFCLPQQWFHVALTQCFMSLRPNISLSNCPRYFKLCGALCSLQYYCRHSYVAQRDVWITEWVTKEWVIATVCQRLRGNPRSFCALDHLRGQQRWESVGQRQLEVAGTLPEVAGFFGSFRTVLSRRSACLPLNTFCPTVACVIFGHYGTALKYHHFCSQARLICVVRNDWTKQILAVAKETIQL